MPDPFLIFLGIWLVFIVVPCWLAGSTWIARANEHLGQADDSSVEHAYPTA